MSQCNMQGFISDEMDEKFACCFPEGMDATSYLQAYLPNNGDRKFFGYCKETEEWIQLVNKNGRLWIEVGEAAA